jgi:hypothetical protein
MQTVALPEELPFGVSVTYSAATKRHYVWVDSVTWERTPEEQARIIELITTYHPHGAHQDGGEQGHRR